MSADTPFARWRGRMGQKLSLGKPVAKAEAAAMIGYSAPNMATRFERSETLPITVALACAAVEAGLKPIRVGGLVDNQS